MTPQDFCYWLKGFLEMGDPKDMNEGQMKMLKKHLDLVFVNVTADPAPEKEILSDSRTEAQHIRDILDGRPGLICSSGGGLGGGGISYC